ncbi:MAG TPA: ATP-binding protein [Vicinamibacterales bacterium]
MGLTAIVAALSAALAFAVLRLFAAAREAARGTKTDSPESAFVAAALEDAVRRLKTQERAMQARAEASERLSGEIIASLTSGLLVVDHDDLLVTLNPAGRRLLDLPETGRAEDFRRALGGRASGLADVIEECLSKGEPIVRRTVTLGTGPDGATHVGVTVSPIGDERGHAHGAICLFSDLSAIVALEEQLRLKDSLARLGELTAGIAHEFRNGLATIHGYARLLDLDRLPADVRPYVQGIRDETEAMGQIVTKFLNFARPTELTLAPVDLRGIAERAADEIRADARSKGGDVVVRGDFAPVEGDEVLLRQAVSNLCRNAIEACAEARVPPRITIEGLCEHGQIRMSVVDNGPGIDPKVAPKMFRPFVTTRARGTGLGLALVQKIVVTHNGRVTAHDEPGGGARFTVILPASARAE